MFKSILTASILSLAMFSANASEGKASVFVEASSDALYRGQSVTDGKPAVSAGLRLTDLVVDGTFVNLQGTTHDLGNLDSDGTIRTDLEVGYGRTFADRYSLSASVARVTNPVLYSANYTEARLDGAVRLTDKLFATGQYAQILTKEVGNDRYASLGLEYKGLFVDQLSVGGKLSYQSYDLSDRTEFNNAELFATYALTKNVEAFGLYSWGGKSFGHAVDAFDVKFAKSDIGDHGQVGVRVRF